MMPENGATPTAAPTTMMAQPRDPLLQTSHAAAVLSTDPGRSAPGTTAGMRESAALPHQQPTPTIESLDYELHETDQYLKFVASRRSPGRLTGFLAMRWVLIALTGVCTALTAIFIDFTILHLFNARYAILQALLKAKYAAPILLATHMGMCIVFASVAGALVCFVEPLAAGSGIPEVKCRLNGIGLPNVVAPHTLAAKAVGVLFSVAASLPCGKEGPMIHSGAIFGRLMAWAGSKLHPEQTEWETESRDFIAAGAAAGVASAFGAPLGGVLFAMEEGSSFWNIRILLRTFVCAWAAALTLDFFLVGLQGVMPWGTLGALGVLSFGSFQRRPSTTYRFWELPIFALVGVLGGLLGMLFNAMNIVLTRWRMRHIGPRGYRRFLEVLVVTGAISAAFFSVPMANHSCYVPTIHDDATRSDLSCDIQAKNHEQTSAVALFTAPGEDSIKALFHSDSNFDSLTLLLFAGIYYLLACWTYGLGVPSGLFVPALLTGAAFGRLFGQVLNQLPLDLDFANPGDYALIGAAAALSGMARITISLAVILMEATGNVQWSLPVLLTVLVSKWVGDFFNQGIYDVHIGLKKLPLLEPFAARKFIHQRVQDVMVHEVVCLDREVKVQKLVNVLERCSHAGFPVVEPGTRRFCGLARRSVLLHMLRYGREHGVFRESEDTATRMAHSRDMLVPHAVAAGQKVPRWPTEALLGPEDYSKIVELGPYVDRGALVVRTETTLRRAYMLFRTMGLRHLPVLQEDGTVAGILTRASFAMAAHLHDSTAALATAPAASAPAVV